MDWMIGKPYRFRSFNCWDYVVEIRKQAGVKTAMFKPKTLDNAMTMFTAQMQKLGHGLTRVSTAKNFDICIVSKRQAGKTIYHCGVYYDGQICHNSGTHGQVISEPFNQFKSIYDEFSLWR